MVQSTTEEFSIRLNQAVAAHPLAPPTPHGRVTWLMRGLSAHMGVKVSLNAAHKWLTGASRPREDRVRELAHFLQVDDVWLAFGKTPTETPAMKEQRAIQASGAALLVAGLVELNGGRITFQDGPASLRVNLAGQDFGICAVASQQSGDSYSVVVPEPVEEARVVVVVPRDSKTPGPAFFELLDVTSIPRQSFGGFSVLELKRASDGTFRPINSKAKLVLLAAVEDLVAA